MAVQLARTLHRFAKLPDDLLDALRAEPWIAPFGPLLPALFAGPPQMTPSYAVMALHKIPHRRAASLRAAVSVRHSEEVCSIHCISIVR